MEILSALPNESSRLTEEGSLLVMDLLVRLKSGALINVEIQKIGYLFPGQYLHRARQQFDTGLQLDMVQEYLLIPLDIFLESRHNINNRLDAWLMLIASDRPEPLLTVPPHPHPNHHPNPHIQTHQGGQSIADKGQRQSGIWHKARDHAEVHKSLSPNPGAHPGAD